MNLRFNNFFSGQRGLEVRGNGSGQTLSLDLHDGGGGGHGGDYLAGAKSL